MTLPVVAALAGGALLTLIGAALARRRLRALRVSRAQFLQALADIEAAPAEAAPLVRFLGRFAADPDLRRLPFDRAYRLALALLAAHPAHAALREFAAAVGRLHHGRRRWSGRPTARDENEVDREVARRAGGR